MTNRFLMAGMVLGLAMAGAVFSQKVEAAQTRTIEPVRVGLLDTVDAEFTRHNREHRMWEIQRNTEMQQRGRGYGPPPGRGYRRDDGYGRGYGRGDGYGRGYGRGDGYGRERRYGY